MINRASKSDASRVGEDGIYFGQLVFGEEGVA
jgi:hypothetical protein